MPTEPRDTDIETLYALADDEGILVLEEFDDSESGWGRFLRLRPGASRPAWTHTLLSFNLVPPVRTGDDVFLAGLAFAARVNARTGRFAWRHVGRYETGDMDAPQRLKISADRIVVRGTAGGRPAIACFAKTNGAVMPCP